MKTLTIYQTGERFITDGMGLSLHGGVIHKEVSLEKATEAELKQLKENPHNDSLLAEISARG